MSRINGTVKFFNHSRGFGFIAPEGGEKDVFVHASALERSGVPAIDEGDNVTFEIEDDPRGRGKQATNIQLA
ncbi:Cold shock-like protein CspC [Methyloligella halotolerans]|uniref:Cold shock-like protein CspC n=1 Tax=Methyloligella halotolerans TaxID=1177755 RepID=A0A1E2S3J1_9HYPH|nr:cold-shock protein [Methyloligella halotolerans]ODA68970.1 Cold shock-like protein CspC [Methyloligella halotolerans]